MAREFDRQKMLLNISTLIQQRGMKIGELESSVGVSAGYLSRLGKEESKAIPSIDIIWKIAKELEVNVELLIEGNFDHSTDNIAYLQKFVQRVFDLTVSGELEWASHSVSDIGYVLRGEETGYYPIIECNPQRKFEDHSNDLRETGYDRGTQMVAGIRRIRSYTRPKADVVAADSCFYTDLENGKLLHIFKYAEAMYQSDEDFEAGIPDAVEWFELVFDDAQSEELYITPVCNTIGNCSSLKPDIEKLYQELKQHEYDLRISRNVRGIIDSFMKASEDDELPF